MNAVINSFSPIYDLSGRSMSIDELLIAQHRSFKKGSIQTTESIFSNLHFADLSAEQQHRLALDVIFFSLNFPGTFQLVSIGPDNYPSFFVN